MNLTIFANFRIDEHDRFARLKKSFFSFYKANIDNWVINTRGKYKLEVNDFLKKNITQSCKLFTMQSKDGWFSESRELLKEIKTDYVFLWNEDHKNLQNINKFNEIIEEIKKCNIDSFTYSFFVNGDLPWSIKIIDEHQESKNLLYLDYDERLHQKRIKIIKKNKSMAQNYIISLISIMKTNFFKKIILANDPPIKRWSKFTPFDFEKGPEDNHWLPFLFAVPKIEFFQCIDKDWDREGNIFYKQDKPETKKKIYFYFYNIAKFFGKSLVIYIRELINNKISRSKKLNND